MKKILSLAIVVLFLGCTSFERNLCEKDSDCIASKCCHSTGCTIKDKAPDCSDVACTLECKPETLDCGQAECKCIGGTCQTVLLDKVKTTESIVE